MLKKVIEKYIESYINELFINEIKEKFIVYKVDFKNYKINHEKYTEIIICNKRVFIYNWKNNLYNYININECVKIIKTNLKKK